MNSHVPHQATFFYRGKWSREMDTLLLSTLITLRSGREWDALNLPKEVLNNVCTVLNPPFGAALSTVDVSDHLKLLSARYRLFKKVVRTHGVQWNQEDRVVTADDHTWKQIIERDASAAAYYYRDEPESTLLVSVFGLNGVKVEFPHEVITLSDTTEIIVLSESVVPDAPRRGVPYDSSADLDEVTSPMPCPSTRVSRKLFDVGISEASPMNSPTRFQQEKKTTFSSPKDSSCASWSACPSSRKT